MLNEIKSVYILRKIFDNLYIKTNLKIIKNNNKLKQKLNISLNNYIKIHNQIEIVIIPLEKENLPSAENTFINYNKKYSSHYHIFFNNDYTNEIPFNYITKFDNISQIKIIIDPEIKSFKELFKRCYCLKEFYLIKYYRKDISDLSYLFCGCSSLINLDISKLDTSNVNNMSGMFWGCALLKEVNLSSFNTFNVTNMHCLFNFCSSLKKVNLDNFNTEKVTDMSNMFEACEKLEEINLYNFNTINVKNMCAMFFRNVVH